MPPKRDDLQTSRRQMARRMPRLALETIPPLTVQTIPPLKVRARGTREQEPLTRQAQGTREQDEHLQIEAQRARDTLQEITARDTVSEINVPTRTVIRPPEYQTRAIPEEPHICIEISALYSLATAMNKLAAWHSSMGGRALGAPCLRKVGDRDPEGRITATVHTNDTAFTMTLIRGEWTWAR